MNTHASAVDAYLQRAQRRLRIIAAGYGAACGLLLALFVLLALGPRNTQVSAAIALALAGGVLGAGVAVFLQRQGRPTAAHVEERTPHSRNVVRTAGELLARPQTVRASIAAAVFRDAARVLGERQPHALFPARNAALALGSGAAVWAVTLALLLGGASPTAVSARGGAGAEAPAIEDVVITITPPSYTGRAAQQLTSPQRIEALAGSRLEISFTARAHTVVLETLHGARAVERLNANRFSVVATADADGFFALEPRDEHGSAGVRHLIGLTVLPDVLPRVRITAPAKDLLLPNGARAVDVAVEAADDIALQSLQLSFTRVSGFGEQFTFSEGEIPLRIVRTSAQAWTASAPWQLAPLQLTPGDMLVYRARARDARPGAPAGESDTYMIEIVVPNAAVAGGVAVDDEFDRYALSQQMIIVLTERLMARRTSLSAPEFTTEAQALAAAQRRVRAEFVFMLGGELEAEVGDDPQELHEEAHARADADVAEGRLANLGRIELSRAIQAMSTAATALSRTEMDAALAAERLALQHVQRAFARTRYILRALNERERIDVARRLTGLLADAVSDRRPAGEAAIDPLLAALRRVVAELAALHSAPPPAAANQTTELAQRLLRIDPASASLRSVADTLAAAANAFAARESDLARGHIDGALRAMAALVRARVPAAPVAQPLARRMVAGSVADARRDSVPR